jgi:hypothetical protein
MMAEFNPEWWVAGAIVSADEPTRTSRPSAEQPMNALRSG